MKDALGHGSDGTGAHASGVAAVPNKDTSFNSGVSDAQYHNNMPIENYTSQVSDLLGMWGGGGLTTSKLSPSEASQVTKAYNNREDWRSLAANMHIARQQDAKKLGAKLGIDTSRGHDFNKDPK